MFAAFRMQATHGHVWQAHNADCRTNVVCSFSRPFSGALAMSVLWCLLKAHLPRACISAIRMLGEPAKHKGLPSARMTCFGPLLTTVLPPTVNSTPPAWLSMMSVFPGWMYRPWEILPQAVEHGL